MINIGTWTGKGGDASPPIFGFIHVAAMGNWRSDLASQLRRIIASGLYQRCRRIFACISGEDSAEPPGSLLARLEYVRVSECAALHEFPTLDFLHQFCGGIVPAQVFYVHLKGLTRQSAEIADWRQYMEHWIIDRHDSCTGTLRTHDVCGIELRQQPWPHFSGNFWWARSEHLRTLPRLQWVEDDPERCTANRLDCERWVCSGRPRLACLCNTGVNLYHERIPDRRHDAPRAAAPPIDPARQPRIGVLFDKQLRRDTTGIHCERALRDLADVVHLTPGISGKRSDLDGLIAVDDGLDYPMPNLGCPSAFWAIDTHVDPDRVAARARGADLVFCAQSSGIEALGSRSVPGASWMPLACDPSVHRPVQQPRLRPFAFVGHMNTPRRRAVFEALLQRYPTGYAGTADWRRLGHIYSSAAAAVNLAVGSDVNMRVFEALGSGTVLLTTGRNEGDLRALFQDEVELRTFESLPELESMIAAISGRWSEHEMLATRGRWRVLTSHTYRLRMQAILAAMRLLPSLTG